MTYKNYKDSKTQCNCYNEMNTVKTEIRQILRETPSTLAMIKYAKAELGRMRT